VIRIGIASLSLGAAAVHAGVSGEHFREYWVFGVFFVAVTALQVAWAVLVLARPSPRLYTLGVLGTCLLVVTWVASRTVGAPIGPSAGSPESVGMLDSVATGFEILIAAGALMLIRTRLGSRPLSSMTAAFASGGAAFAIGSGTVVALVMASAGGEPAREPVATIGDGLIRAHLIHFILVFGSLIFLAGYAFVTRPRDTSRSEGVPEIAAEPSTPVSNPRTSLEVAS
jgi:hypothetical protein